MSNSHSNTARGLCTADLHVHTNRSFCAPATTTLSSYLPLCAQEGIQTLGISNHFYPSSGIQHTLQVREEVTAAQDVSCVNLLVGCEAEVFYGRPPTLQKEEAQHFDYVLLAPSHIFNLPQEYTGFDLSTSEKIRQLLFDNFKQACMLDLGVPTGICHPLYPICAPGQQEILDGMTEKQLGECYSLAAMQQKSIEIHACVYRDTVDLDGEGLSPSYIRMLSIAKECGCRFHFGSDAHTPKMFSGVHGLLARAAERAGITEYDLWDFVRR